MVTKVINNSRDFENFGKFRPERSDSIKDGRGQIAFQKWVFIC